MAIKQFAALIMAMLTVFGVYGVGPAPEPEPDLETEVDVDFPIDDMGDADFPIDDMGDVDFSDAPNPVVTFFVRSKYASEINGEWYASASVSDALYRRNEAVTQQTGVDISCIAQDGSWGYYKEWNQTLRNAVQTVSRDFDAAMIYAGASSSLVIEGLYTDLDDLDYLSSDQPWWDQSVTEGASVYGMQYFAGGDLTLSRLGETDVIWYNKDIYDDYCANSRRAPLSEVVIDGEWTLDYLYEIVSEVWNDADRNGVLSSGDTVGFGGFAYSDIGTMDAWLYALGCDLTEMDTSIGEPVPAFYVDHTFDAYDALVKFYTQNPGTFATLSSSKGTGNTHFYNDNMMMLPETLDYGFALRGMGFDYGVLPMPKFDTAQENYRTIAESSSSLLVVLSTVEASRIDMVSATLELMARESYKSVTPVFISELLSGTEEP